MSLQDVRVIRENYDRVAVEYTRALYHELESKPFDCDVLDRFASSIGGGRVCDAGCGPGHVAAYLASRGCQVVGLDISPEMIAIARKLSPDVAFFEADMTAIPFPDESLNAIVAFYAIVNSDEETLPSIFTEMRRVLKPLGRLLLAFHVGDATVEPGSMWDIPVSLKFKFFPTSSVLRLLESAGFVVDQVLERDPYPPQIEHQSRRAYVTAHSAVGV